MRATRRVGRAAVTAVSLAAVAIGATAAPALAGHGTGLDGVMPAGSGCDGAAHATRIWHQAFKDEAGRVGAYVDIYYSHTCKTAWTHTWEAGRGRLVSAQAWSPVFGSHVASGYAPDVTTPMLYSPGNDEYLVQASVWVRATTNSQDKAGVYSRTQLEDVTCIDVCRVTPI